MSRFNLKVMQRKGKRTLLLLAIGEVNGEEIAYELGTIKNADAAKMFNLVLEDITNDSRLREQTTV